MAHDPTDLWARRRPDLGQRDLTASRPNKIWIADPPYLRCWEGLVSFAFVIDAFSRKVVGWQRDALKMALGQRGGGAEVELIHHSDRGFAVHQHRLQLDTPPSRAARAPIGW